MQAQKHAAQSHDYAHNSVDLRDVRAYANTSACKSRSGCHCHVCGNAVRERIEKEREGESERKTDRQRERERKIDRE